MKRLASILVIGLGLAANLRAAPPSAPYLIENKVQSDLENSLSRLIPHEQFLVQVFADISTKTEKRVLEGQTIDNYIDEDDTDYDDGGDVVVPSMPGFVLEPKFAQKKVKPQLPQQSRETYHVTEVPVLNALRVQIALDDLVEPQTLARAKSLVQGYLQLNYPKESTVAFAQIPMLKPSPSPTASPSPSPVAELENARRDLSSIPDEAQKEFFALARWSIFAIVALVALMVLWRIFAPVPQMASASAPQSALPSLAGLGELLGRGERTSRKKSAKEPGAEKGEGAPGRRRRLLEKFLSHPDAFRLFYDRASNPDREEIFAALKGPAYQSLLEGLGFKLPLEVEVDAESLDEKLAGQERTFDEFVQASEWEEKQFFGFLRQLTPEQLVGLGRSQSAKATCVMLRFMKPNQSAQMLDQLPAEKRQEVLAYAVNLNSMNMAELVDLEKQIREAYHRLPGVMFKYGEETNFWGNVLSESQNQEQMLDSIEKTNPGIAPNIRKFKFALEDVATLPDGILSRVLGEVDNEELGLALVTCKSDVADVILDSVSPKRRELIRGQIDSFRSAEPETQKNARAQLTKRFREVLS